MLKTGIIKWYQCTKNVIKNKNKIKCNWKYNFMITLDLISIYCGHDS